MGEPLQSIKFKTDTFQVAKADATFVSNPFRQIAGMEKFFEGNEKIKIEREFAKMQAEKADKAYQQKKETVEYIIENDPAAPKKLNKEQMAEYIMHASEEFGVDAVVVASIAQQETHFNQDVPSKNGSGVMQLTSISIKDMFQRPKLYGEAMKPILAKYKTPANLIKAMRKDPELNIRLGTALYKAKLKEARGNEKEALKRYNGSSIKVKYSNDVYAKIIKARQNTSYECEA